MAHALGVKRLDLYLQFDRPLEAGELDAIRELIRRRGAHEPVAYLVGEREFYSLPFDVDPRVLVPRPETEHLVEVALPVLTEGEAPVFCDVGTGSGCVAVALLHGVPEARCLATDLSADALAVARINAERNEVADRLELFAGDLLEPLRAHGAWGQLDAVVSNPPYIVRGDPSVEVGVDQHEPADALYVPGDDPLALVRRIAEAAGEALAPGGLLAVEVGHESGADAASLLTELGYDAVALAQDLGGIDRIASGRKPTVSP